jgi:hypothetical protein
VEKEVKFYQNQAAAALAERDKAVVEVCDPLHYSLGCKRKGSVINISYLK